MPKEVIHPSHPRVDGESAAVPLVKWGEHGGVQLATINPEAGLEELKPNYDDKGNPLVDDWHPIRGWYVDLDRHQINKLIKALRRARDKAYGRDA